MSKGKRRGRARATNCRDCEALLDDDNHSTGSTNRCKQCWCVYQLKYYHEHKGPSKRKPAATHCKTCGDPLTDANRASTKNMCRPCWARYMRDWNRDNREHVREYHRTHHDPAKAKANMLMWKYQLSMDQYGEMLAKQGGVCAICGQVERQIHPRSKRQRALAVDHDSTTEAIRGLLCNDCNRGIGLLGHDVDRLVAAIVYLQAASQRQLDAA